MARFCCSIYFDADHSIVPKVITNDIYDTFKSIIAEFKSKLTDRSLIFHQVNLLNDGATWFCVCSVYGEIDVEEDFDIDDLKYEFGEIAKEAFEDNEYCMIVNII